MSLLLSFNKDSIKSMKNVNAVQFSTTFCLNFNKITKHMYYERTIDASSKAQAC